VVAILCVTTVERPIRVNYFLLSHTRFISWAQQIILVVNKKSNIAAMRTLTVR